MSTNCHFGRELSRRDDMEAILYLAVFLRKGQLPWHGFTGTPMEKNIQTGLLRWCCSINSTFNQLFPFPQVK